ncbi:unnamed protein product [Rotaria sp. Silwood1]|nr:unnamed protein product [Rotaria sp. Silwood1]
MWLPLIKSSPIFHMMYDYVVFIIILSVCVAFANVASIQTQPYKVINVATRTWDEAIALAKEFTAQMTLEEKCNMTAGVGSHCAGFVSPVPHLHFGGLCFQDSPSGVGDGVQFSTAFIAGIQIAATWDRDLFYQRAAAIGQEFRGKGIHFALGPMMNIDRNALHGRNWEGFGQIGGPVSLSICVHSPSELCTTRNEVHEISFPRKFDVAPNVAVSLAGFDSYAGMESEIP